MFDLVVMEESIDRLQISSIIQGKSSFNEIWNADTVFLPSEVVSAKFSGLIDGHHLMANVHSTDKNDMKRNSSKYQRMPKIDIRLSKTLSLSGNVWQTG